jgi:CRP/FNR family transcriptional regulator
MMSLPKMSFQKDSYIVIEGTDNPGRFFIIVEGEAQIRTQSFIQNRKHRNLGPGDSFATVSCLSGYKEIQTVQAMTEIVLYTVARAQFFDMVKSNEPAAMDILMQFIRDINTLNSMIINISDKRVRRGKKKGEEADSPGSQLFRIGEFYKTQELYNLAYYAFHRCVQNFPDSACAVAAETEMEQIKPRVTEIKFDFTQQEFRRVYPPNTMLFAESELSRALFLIIRGKVKIAQIRDGKEIIITFLEAGDICGEMTMLDSRPHVSNAIAFEECEVFAVGPQGFNTMKNYPRLIYQLSSILAARIWFLTKLIACRGLYEPVSRLYAVLAVLVERENAAKPRSKNKRVYLRFDAQEVIGLAGYSPQNGEFAMRKMLMDKIAALEENDIVILDKEALLRRN